MFHFFFKLIPILMEIIDRLFIHSRLFLFNFSSEVRFNVILKSETLGEDEVYVT